VTDDYNLSENARKIFNDLYSLKEETLKDTFNRVATEFARDEEELEKANMLLSEGFWRPNTPVWLNAGSNHKIYSACFTAGLNDSMDSIYDVANVARKIFQYGSGIGIPIGNLRESESFIYEGDPDAVPEGKSSGPITFMKLFDAVGGTTKSGGRVRRAAILCSMLVHHPDILKFIHCKNIDGTLSNMNISVSITDEFMKALDDGIPFKLRSPYRDEVRGEIDPQVIWDEIAEMSHKTGDPGVIFIDTMNKYNPLIKTMAIEVPNPCIIGNTLVQTVEGNIPIKHLVGKEIDVYCKDENNELTISKATNIRKTRKNAKLVRIKTTREDLICTPDHKIFTKNLGWIEAKYLTPKDRIIGLNRKMMNESYSGVALTGGKYIREHRFIMSHYNNIEGLDVHHTDNNTLHNVKSNLSIEKHSEHSIMSNIGHEDWSIRNDLGMFVKKEIKKKKVQLKTNRKVGTNLRIISVEHLNYKEDVYDLEVSEYHNFIANGIVIHNCGEQPLIPFGACNLSAINLNKFVTPDGFDWDALYSETSVVMQLMDNIIDVMDFPDPRYKDNVIKYRPVGIGIMGLADVMYTLNLKYDGADGREFASRVMKVMTTACVGRSAILAKEHGPFHDYDIHRVEMERIIAEHIGFNDPVVEKMAKIVMGNVKKYGVRNIQFTTCQPTGTTALSVDASYGIEPSMGLVFKKNLISGETMMIVNPVFEERFKNEDWYNENLASKIFKNGGSLKGLRGIPKEIKDIFVVAHDIKYIDRIEMQSVLQKYCSTAISSTINLPATSTPEEISEIYKLAYVKGLKGITVYRDGSKSDQPVSFKGQEKIDITFKRPTKMTSNTFAVSTGAGKMYVTISDYNGRPWEVFLNLGKSGQIYNTFSEAIGRLISIGLQNNVPMDFITKTLIGINSNRTTWHRFEETDKKPTQILSIPDGLAQLLDRYYNNSNINFVEQVEDGKVCDKCNSIMLSVEGCFTCASCGNSECA
jgi:ribonucleoside-diphosphate reductase alpha chain